MQPTPDSDILGDLHARMQLGNDKVQLVIGRSSVDSIIETINDALRVLVGRAGPNFNRCLDAQSSRITEITVADGGIKSRSRDCLVSSKASLDLVKECINSGNIGWDEATQLHKQFNDVYTEADECLNDVKELADSLILRISENIKACMQQQ